MHRVGRHQQVAAQVEIAFPGGQFRCLRNGFRGDLEVGYHRAALLREADLVERADPPAVDHRRRGEDLRDRDDPGAADAGDADIEVARPALGLGQRVGAQLAEPTPRPAAAGHHGQERRAVAGQARVVDVARGLVDLGLAAELGGHRLHGKAIGLAAAIPATLADPLVDQHLLRRGGLLAPAALASLLGRAFLVVDKHRHPRDGGEFLLGAQQFIAVPDVDAPGQLAAQPLGSITGDDNLGDALQQQHLGQPRQRESADRVLAAGHRHGRVVQQLVGDVDPGGDGGAHGEAAGVRERAVADVLHEVLGADERGHADPLGALAAHLRDADDVADLVGVHEQRHGVTADSGAHHRPVRHLRRGIVRAARAEVRRARQQRDGDAFATAALLPGVDRLHLAVRGQPVGQTPGDPVRVELAELGEQGPAIRPFLAVHRGSIGAAVEDFLDRRFEERALLLHHDDLRQPGGEVPDELRIERVDRAELEQPDPVAGQIRVVEAERAQGLADVQIGLSGRHDADPVVLPRAHQPVYVAVPQVFHRQRQAEVVQAVLQGGEFGAEQARARAVRVRLRLGRDLGRGPGRCHDRGPRRIRHVGDHLHRRPQAAGPRHLHRVQSEIEQVLRVRREEHRHRQVRQRRLRGRRNGRGLRIRVVADQRDRAAARIGSGKVGVPHCVAGPVQARCLAVPDAHHPVRALRAEPFGELAAHHRRGRQFLVQAGPVDHVVLGEQLRAAGQLQVEPGQRRALVAGDERRRPVPAAPVVPDPVEQQPHQSLHTGHVDLARFP